MGWNTADKTRFRDKPTTFYSGKMRLVFDFDLSQQEILPERSTASTRNALQLFLNLPQSHLSDRIHQNRQSGRPFGLAKTVQAELRLPDLRSGNGINALAGIGIQGGVGAATGRQESERQHHKTAKNYL